MKSIFFLLLFSCCFISGCRKEETVEYSGRLLFTKKFPTPIANREISLRQVGAAIDTSSGLAAGEARTVTDANGFFNIAFRPASFTLSPGWNSNSLLLTSDTVFPRFSRVNYPGPEYGENSPIYIGKVVDTAVIRVTVSANLSATDTMGLEGLTLSGKFYKEYSGRTAAAGSTIVLDTLQNLLFTNFDCSHQTFYNNLLGGRRLISSSGHVTIHGIMTHPQQLSADDEGLKEFTFYYAK